MVNKIPQYNPIIARFSTESVAIHALTNEDVLAVPEDMAAYTIIDYTTQENKFMYRENQKQ